MISALSNIIEESVIASAAKQSPILAARAWEPGQAGKSASMENQPYEVCRADIPIRRIFTYIIHLLQLWKPALLVVTKLKNGWHPKNGCLRIVMAGA